jgi:hypothetical protein
MWMNRDDFKIEALLTWLAGFSKSYPSGDSHHRQERTAFGSAHISYRGSF